MRISVRNQIGTTVAAVEKGAVNARVTLRAPQGTEFCAIITNEAAEALQLQPGAEVTTFFKASHVLIAAGGVPKLSARNKIAGSVETIVTGAINAEIVIKVPGGDRLIAVITNEAVGDLALEEGTEVVAIIKATDVMIAESSTHLKGNHP